MQHIILIDENPLSRESLQRWLEGSEVGLSAHDAVEERGLARIGRSDYGDRREPTLEWSP